MIYNNEQLVKFLKKEAEIKCHQWFSLVI